MADMSPEMMQILSARQALRVLDAAIVRTETRLRYLPSLIAPPAVGGGTGVPGVSPMPGRRVGPLTQAKNGVPFKMTTNGMVLNKSFFGKMGIPIAAFAAPAIAGAVMDQAAGLIQGMKDIRKAGGTSGDVAAQAGVSVADTLMTPGRMALSGAANLYRAFGGVGAPTDEGFEEGRLSNRVGFRARERDKLRAQAIAKVGNDLRKQYREAYEFVDGWTPEDFDVAGDVDRKDLGIEMRRINQGRLEAWMDDQHNSRTRKAVRDASGD